MSVSTRLPGLPWLQAHDRGLAATRRAARAAIAIPVLIAVGDQVLHNPVLTTFAVFGSFALLVLVDFGGSPGDRLVAEATLAASGAVLVCVGTLLSRATWLAVAGTAVVALVVLLSGVVSSVLAGATVALLLAFVLPVSLAGGISSLPDRLAGWGLASAAALVAVPLLWPAPSRDALRAAAVDACRAVARRLQAESRAALEPSDDTEREREDATAASDAALAAVARTFYATPFRPTGLSTGARSAVRLVDELAWLGGLLAQRPSTKADAHACAVRRASAEVLDRAADALLGGDPSGSAAARERLHEALLAAEDAAASVLPERWAGGEGAGHVDALDPAFRAQELSFAVRQIAVNAENAAAADRRSRVDRLLGRRPTGAPGTLGGAGARLRAHLEPHSVWLHNSLRGAAGLALSVLVATETGVQHSFWVVLGTLSVLRSNALNTGQNALRAVLGTAAGFVVAAGLLAAIGTDHTAIWVLLPFAILLAGLAPAVVSFAAGQAAFTMLLVLVFNLLAPSGWRVGLLRVEDIAIGCAVSVAVGVLFWPRGAASVLRTELGEAYEEATRYLVAAVDFGADRCEAGTPRRPAPDVERDRAAAAARRLDDAFRTYLAEGGAKPVPLAETTTLVTGVVALRLAADAIVELWERGDGAEGDRAGARAELTTAADRVAGWYRRLAAAFGGAGAVPDPLGADTAADGRLVAALRADLLADDGRATGTAVRLIWTADHLDAIRRLQASLAGPGRRTAAAESSLVPAWWRREAPGAAAAEAR
jgi:uncharacterized membrane protein YccC